MIDPARALAWGKAWGDAFLSLVYPNVCDICHKQSATAADGFVCISCQKTFQYVTPPFCSRCGLNFEGAITTTFDCWNCRDMKLHFSYARSAVMARGTMLDIIHKYKYSGALWFEALLGRILADAAQQVLIGQSWDMIVPVPLHRIRLAEREFNQAERLAECLGKRLGLIVENQLLTRIRSTESQTTKTREERLENVRNAFTLNQKQAKVAQGKRLVLVDDVMTTGATTNACAKELRKAGAADVCVWTLARGGLLR